MKKLTLALVCTCLAAPFAAAEIPAKYNFAQIEGKLGTQPKKVKTVPYREAEPTDREKIARNVFGKIEIVRGNGDFKIEIVSGNADFKVEIVRGCLD